MNKRQIRKLYKKLYWYKQIPNIKSLVKFNTNGNFTFINPHGVKCRFTHWESVLNGSKYLASLIKGKTPNLKRTKKELRNRIGNGFKKNKRKV